MNEKDWIILRLLRGMTPQFAKLSPRGQRDYTKAMLYVIKEYGIDAIQDHIETLAREAS